MPGEMIALISVACAIIGAVIGVLGNSRATRKSITDEGKASGVVLTELGYIKALTEDVRREQREQNDRHHALALEVARIDASARQAHKRIDLIEKKGSV